jgi:hypothetical protein
LKLASAISESGQESLDHQRLVLACRANGIAGRRRSALRENARGSYAMAARVFRLRRASDRARSVTAAQVTDLRGSQAARRRARLFHAMSAGASTELPGVVGNMRVGCRDPT